MKNISKNNVPLKILILICLLFAFGLSSCQTDGNITTPEVIDSQVENKVPTQAGVNTTNEEVELKSTDEQPSGNTDTNSEPVNNEEVPMPTEMSGPVDPAVIEAAWNASPHANSFVEDEQGRNNDCARCHAPIEWSPTMDDLPESCFTCKFELSEPPSYIAEDKWQAIPCKVCHQVDKKGNVEPEYSWLEVAPLDEYVAVENVTELCMKCHAPVNVREHVAVEIGGAHAEEGYVCTDCHDAHELTRSCGDSDCHEGLNDPEKVIPGHDEDHSNVSCEACHDASGMEFGLDEESGTWVTYATWSVETEETSESGQIPFTSHNTILESDCERCHYQGNPWELSSDIETP